MTPLGSPIVGGTTYTGGDLFGWSCAFNGAGAVMVVGSPDYSGAVSRQGGVYTYDRSGDSWVQRGAVLTAPDPSTFFGFGKAVALSDDGTVLVVGDPSHSTNNQGAVYVYDWSGSAWVQRGSTMFAADAASFDEFGTSVAISNNGLILAVGASTRDGSVVDQGGVYIYDWSGSAWVQRGSVLLAADATTYDQFGWSVAFDGSGTILVVGAIAKEGGGTGQGGVYVYDWSGSAWVQRGSVLLGAGIQNADGFGSAVALNDAGTILAVGAYGWDHDVANSNNNGAIFLYDWSGSAWVQRPDLVESPDWNPGDLFGASVALSSDGALMGAGSWVHQTTYNYQGAMYLFTDTVTPPPATVTINLLPGHIVFNGAMLTVTVTPPDPPAVVSSPPLCATVEVACCLCDCGTVDCAALRGVVVYAPLAPNVKTLCCPCS